VPGVRQLEDRFEVRDARRAEFWLDHCGALMDVEPRGEAAVVMMCHRIEDPTFDATAVATNPRARVRPVHRPPRTPRDRQPHCRWAISIEPDAAPLVEEPLTREVGRLPLARVANEAPADREPGGWRDYAGPFDPGFRLERLSQGALEAVLREFSLQVHLLASAASLHLSGRHAEGEVREVLANQWAILDPGAPGWLGLLAAGDPRGIEAIAQAVDPRARLCAGPALGFAIEVDPGAEPAREPQSAALTRLSTAAAWKFRDPPR
jgi:hypothetical protein